MKKYFSNKGFTLMEMLIVVTIIGILAAIVLPRFITSSATAERSAHRAERMTINSQLELYYFVFNAYPTAMTDAGWGATDTDGNDINDYQEYFPEGVPTTCNQDVAWAITSGRISQTSHTGHE